MLVPVRGIGQGGIVTDTIEFDLQLNQFSDGNNVVFRDGKAKKSNGWESVTALTREAYWFYTWKDTDGSIYTIFGNDGNLERWDGTTLTTPTIAGAALGSSSDWQMDQFGKFVIINNKASAPRYASVTDGSTFTEFPDWVFGGGGTFDGSTAAIVRPFKSFLIALNVDGDPYTVYWSDESAPDTFPTDWDYTSTTNLAGRNSLDAGDGQLVDGAQLGDAFIVYTDFACYAMRLVGDPNFVFSFTRLFDRGLLNRNCMVQFEGYHFCVGNQAIYVHDGSNVRRVADNKVEERFFGTIGDSSYVYVTKDEVNHEVLIYYNDFSSGDPTYTNKLLRWNWLEDTWSFEDIDAGDDEVACLSPALTAPSSTTWLALGLFTSWEDLSATTWNELGGQADDVLTMHRLSVDTVSGGSTFWKMEATTQRDGANYYAYLERRKIDLDELTKTTERVKQILAVYPQIDGNGTIKIQVGGAMSPNGSTNWADAQDYDIDDEGQYKIDTRITGRYLDIRIGEWSGTPTNNNWSLSGFDIEVVDGGAR